jgi:hypothetical protein
MEIKSLSLQICGHWSKCQKYYQAWFRKKVQTTDTIFHMSRLNLETTRHDKEAKNVN